MTALAVAGFDAEAPFRAAVAALGADRRHIAGLWSPIPVAWPDADDALPPIAWLMAAAGIAAAGALYLLIWWSAVHSYPFDSGARPANSWPAFLVAPIELGALVAGFAGAIALLVRARLTRLHELAFEIDEVGAAACGRFVVAVRCDAGADANALLGRLAAAGAVHSRLIAR